MIDPKPPEAPDTWCRWAGEARCSPLNVSLLRLKQLVPRLKQLPAKESARDMTTADSLVR